MTPAAELIDRIIASAWETSPEDLPRILGRMTHDDPADYMIIERPLERWPMYLQVASFGGDEDPQLHAELHHPSAGDDNPEHRDARFFASQEAIDALHAAGWHEPKHGYSPNFWIEAPVREADDLARKLMKAMLGNMSTREVSTLEVLAWGPAFGGEADLDCD